ncbi:MAG: Mini-ribonuclease 3 [Oscillospiraceae bacterium]|jgi:ribonuclease-3 family protein|nr:Mini-ribonuclease 3 [Oscillospiraceae bacterium]
MTDSPLALAFLGDAVFELYVREAALAEGDLPVRKLNEYTERFSGAVKQAALLDLLVPLLTPEEADIVRRCKNAKPRRIPASCSAAEYCKATALEGLFGSLWQSGRQERLQELFAAVCRRHTDS